MSESIERIEKVTLKFPRPRFVGKNARKGDHGDIVTDTVVRIHAGGTYGVGWSRLDRAEAEQLVGQPVAALFQAGTGCTDAGFPIDLPLWDWAARKEDEPLYRLLGSRGSTEIELYDGSIYIYDIGKSNRETIEIFKDEVATGHHYGYHNFKIKIGRGARWMGIEEGLNRDVLVIHTIREAAGDDAKILIDANNGTTMNIAIEILKRCEDVGIYWFEEAFPEDTEFNKAFKTFIKDQGYDTFVADGESGPPPPNYFDMVEKGWIDIVQHDFRAKGLTWWRETADRIAPWGARCAPHCWGSLIERYAHAHFAASIPNFSLLEAAPADTPGVLLDGWKQKDGKLIVPDTPGTGFNLEPEIWKAGVDKDDGFIFSA